MYILISLALFSVFTSKSLGSGLEILTILFFIYQILVKKEKNFPKCLSFKFGAIIAFLTLTVSIINVALGKIQLKDLSILRHDFYPLCLAGLLLCKIKSIHHFKDFIEKTLPWIFVGILIATLSNVYQASLSEEGLSLLISSKRFGGLTGINELAYSLSGIYGLILAYLLSSLKNKDQFKSYALALFTLLLIFISVYFTKSRGPILAIILVTPVCIFFYFRKFFYYSFFVSLIAILSFGSFLLTKPSLKSRYFLPLNTKSNLQRLVQYQVAIDLMKDFPLGVGLKKYADKSVEYKKKLGYKYQSFRSHAHNTFLHIGAENGVIIGLLFFVFFLYLIYEALLIENLLAKGIFTSSFFTFLIQSMYDHVYQVFFAVLISTILGMYWIYQRDFNHRLR